MEYGCNTAEGMAREMRGLARRMNGDNHRFLVVVGEFDAIEGYLKFGMQSCACWLSWECGFAEVTAREKVRVARALRLMPKISAAMQRGEISYCQVRAITRCAAAEREDALLEIAREGQTVREIEKAVQRIRRGDVREELERGNARHESRYVQAYFDEDGLMLVRAELSPEPGVVVQRALQAAADEIREAEGDSCESGERNGARMADALTLIAERFLAGEGTRSNGDRHLIHVHVDAKVLRDPSAEGRSEIDGYAVPPATVQRLCCDGSLIAVVEDGAGKPLSIGRRTRAIPAAMYRALRVRDGGCRAVGCSNKRFVHAHHIRHWINGGETAMKNLVLLCSWHHRYVHEYGYRVVREGSRVRLERVAQRGGAQL